MKSPVVVAHLLNDFSGSPAVLKTAIEALDKAGHPVYLHTSEGPGFLDEVPAKRRLVWYKWSPSKYGRLLNYGMSQLLLFCSLLRYWKEPVVIYANTLLPAGAALAGKLMGKRVIYHVHETHIDPPAFNKLLLKTVAATADEAIYVSDYLRDFHDFEHLPAHTVYNALGASFAQRASKFKRISPIPGRLNCLMMCSMKKVKGVFEYIELARMLPEHHFTLVLSQQQERVEEFIGNTALPANLDLLHVQRDVHPIYQRADVLLSLSHPIHFPETFGMTIIEGMAYGLPVIVPPVGAPIEIVREGQEGFIRDVRELDTVVEAVQTLARDPEVWQTFSDAARRRAMDFELTQFEEGLRMVFGTGQPECYFKANQGSVA